MKEGPSADCQEITPLIQANANAAVVALQRFGLQSKTCVVTGGTKGIGAAIVFELAALKAKVSNMHVRMTIEQNRVVTAYTAQQYICCCRRGCVVS